MYPTTSKISILHQTTRSHRYLDPNIILEFQAPPHAHTKLLTILYKGTKFIEKPKLNKTSIFQNLKRSIHHFKNKLLHFIPTLESKQFKRWQSHILSTLHTKIKNTPLSHSTTPNLSHSDVKSLIQTIHSHLVINSTDKLPNNYSFTCKQWWAGELLATTLNAPGYKQILKTPAQIIERHTKYLSFHNFIVPQHLPYKRLASKFHKEGTKPLVSASSVTTTNLDKP